MKKKGKKNKIKRSKFKRLNKWKIPAKYLNQSQKDVMLSDVYGHFRVKYKLNK